ncbi:unnamed protein product, partial [Mesorhabditis spiculigera]
MGKYYIFLLAAILCLIGRIYSCPAEYGEDVGVDFAAPLDCTKCVDPVVAPGITYNFRWNRKGCKVVTFLGCETHYYEIEGLIGGLGPLHACRYIPGTGYTWWTPGLNATQKVSCWIGTSRN